MPKSLRQRKASEHPHLIVTSEQKRDGYWRREGTMTYPMKYVVIRKLDDGNYLVHNPEARQK